KCQAPEAPAPGRTHGGQPERLSGRRAALGSRAWRALSGMKAYVLPFVLYLALTQIPAAFPEQYIWLYPSVVMLVGLATIVLLRGRRLIQPHGDILAGVAVGLLGILLWIALCQLHLEEHVAVYFPSWLQPKRAAFNPFESITQPTTRWAFLAARL